MLRLVFVLLFTVFGMSSVAAHTRSESFSSWRTSERQLIGVLHVDAHRATQLARSPQDIGDLQGLLARHVADTVRARQDGQDCAGRPRALSAEPGQLRVEMTFDCPQPLSAAGAELEIVAFREGSPGHVHYTRVAQPTGEVHEAVVAGARTTVTIGGSPRSAPDGLLTFIRIGLEHVLSGLDHMAFLLALMLLAGRPWNAALAASGFTVGHSVTLGLVAFGWLRPNSAAIEALIGFTIAITAALLLAQGGGVGRRRRRHWATVAAAGILVALLPAFAMLIGRSSPPWLVYAGAAACVVGFGGTAGSERAASQSHMAVLLACAFGLVHGAGFAGGLLDLELPRERLLGALLGFNLGVEAGQLVVLGACVAGGVLIRRLPAAAVTFAREAAGAGLFGLGVYWLVARSFL